MTPQHSVTAVTTFLSTRAFDLDRVVLERESMPNAGNEHPVVVYFSGASRYDLDAEYPVGEQMARARDYIRKDHGQPEWKLRRLKALELARCVDEGGTVGKLQAFALGAAPKAMTDTEVQQHVDDHGMDAICDVGEAVLRASSAPKAAEKKL